MNALRIAAICTVAALTGSAWAQDAPSATDTMSTTAAAPSPSADVGGAGNATGAGALTPTRQQVYQDLLRSEQTGEQTRLLRDTYRGN